MTLSANKKRAAGAILLIAIVSLFYASTLISPELVESLTRVAGWYGPLAIAFSLVLTQVFAPLSGTPVMIVGIKLYGYGTAMAILYCSFLVSASINFWIARLYGRTLVKKFVGERALNEIDDLSRIRETSLLVTCRLLGFSFFDFVSYAVGLTKISFRRYFIYTASLTLVPLAGYYFLFSRINFNSFRGLLIYFSSVIAIGAVCARIFYKSYFENFHQQTTRHDKVLSEDTKSEKL
jgi:uncharacterized membrane protein YdjX (TVP38/TMEM64 family)